MKTLKELLEEVIHQDCFIIPDKYNQAFITEEQTDLVDGTKWTQKLTITDLDGDEIILTFDHSTTKGYSHFIKGNSDNCIAKSCDYILLKKEADVWQAYFGELKLGTASFNPTSIKKQISGSEHFLRYVANLINDIENNTELLNINPHYLCIHKKAPITQQERDDFHKKNAKLQAMGMQPIAPNTVFKDKSFDFCNEKLVYQIGLPYSKSNPSQVLKLGEFQAKYLDEQINA